MSSRKQSAWRILAAISLLGIAHQANAQDGVKLIDQAAAAAGNVTPGDAPGFPISITRPGSYRLSGNLTLSDPHGSGIKISADNVTLDLGGFSIIGLNVCTGNPVRCLYSGGGIGIENIFKPNREFPMNVRIQNGTVQGASGYGLSVFGSNVRVQNVRALMNGATAIYTNQGSVTDCHVHRNGFGFSVIAATVRGSTITGNAGGGILATDGLVEGNVVNHNGGTGIRAIRATVVNNVASNNFGFGLEVVCPAVVNGNTANGNANANIATTGGCGMGTNSHRHS